MSDDPPCAASGAEPPPSPAVAVGAVVIASDGRVLLVQRARPPLQGSWSLPGGKPEPGESLVDAIRRELREETGLEVDVLAELGVVRVKGEGFDYAIHEHLCRPRAGTEGQLAPGDDAADAAWVAPAHLAAYGCSAEVVDVVARAGAKLAGVDRP